MAATMSAEEMLVHKKAASTKIISFLRDFLQESETDPGVFQRDVYDALAAQYPSTEAKADFAKSITKLQHALTVECGLPAPRQPLEV